MTFHTINDLCAIDTHPSGHNRPRRRGPVGNDGFFGRRRYDNRGIGKHRQATPVQEETLHIDLLTRQVDRGAKSLHAPGSR